MNFLGTIPMLLSFGANCYFGKESIQAIKTHVLAPKGAAILILSCVIGISISYFSLLARKSVSATSFTVVGNVCKVLTVVINYFIWTKHANNYGLASLSLCLFAAYFYKQAPMRTEAVVKPDEPSKEETAPLNAGTQEVEGGGTAQDREEEI